MNDERSGLRLPHDGYLKRFMLRNVALTQWDTLLVDEFQDANPATAVIVKRQNHMRRIVVGDNNQSIYGFRGAVDAMNFLSGEQRTLTQSFRFGASVARAANAVLAQKGETLEVVGRGGPSQVLFCSAPREVMLLAQTNAQAIQAAKVITASVGGREVLRMTPPNLARVQLNLEMTKCGLGRAK